MSAAARLAGINVYPVKSMAGVALDAAAVEPRGLAGDRRLMVVDRAGEFVTGREHPRLTLISASVDGGTLRLALDGDEAPPVALAADDAEGEPVLIWADRCPGVALDAGVDDWLSRALGIDCRLVQMTDACVRPVDPDHGKAGDEVSFADGYPVLLTAEGSLADLNDRMRGPPVSMRRFRPNLVVDGAEPYAEDDWRRIRIGEVRFDVAKPCDRCKFTTIDPDTAERHPRSEPLRTLATYRNTELGVLFGQNLIPRSTGTVRVGDVVELV